jgi:hypothetical protein
VAVDTGGRLVAEIGKHPGGVHDINAKPRRYAAENEERQDKSSRKSLQQCSEGTG